MNDVGIVGGQNQGSLNRAVHVHKFNTFNGTHNGMLVLNKKFQDFTPTTVPFLNPDFGNSMNQNVAFGGTPELIFDGGSGGTEWSSSGDVEWDFADAGKVVLDHGANGSTALFEDAGTINTTNYTALTGKVDLDNYTPATQDILIQFGVGGALLGVQVSLNAYIDTGNFAEQSFAIPIADFGLAGATVDEFSMTVERTGGHQPHVKFDDFQIEETGTAAVFKVWASDNESHLHVEKVRLVFGDTLATTLADATMAGLDYTKLLGVSALANGIVVQIVLGGKISVSASLKQLSDMIGLGADIISFTSFGGNTMMVLELTFSETLVLRRGLEEQDYISITISDNLGGLDLFTGSARGAYELETFRGELSE